MTLVFVAAAAVAVAGALGVVAARTPVHGVLAMLVNFAGLSALYLTLQSEFLAIAQIIIYAGAVMVLFVFVITILSARNRPVETEVDPLALQLPLALATVGALVAAVLLRVLGPGDRAAGAGGTVTWVAAPEGYGGVAEFGRTLLQGFPFELEVAGLVLLVAMVGVMVIVGRRREAAQPEDGRQDARGLEPAAAAQPPEGQGLAVAPAGSTTHGAGEKR
ncbi:NADH-quinone oxidoreductase subunit J [Carboxydochorda subterranea]|uniref:NADH-quinone oxidoreductase subunit J n=1 Tax=Carboxydichorda subterranea TaxID=3109565 RepID=A0ABZ1BZZ1_9FIRM|nr:NADH-quinone oxidoreductase subunit J [Limnochorda sp. L945t]WRP18198.1 NADH-quinone oxidoreductase subunit J [Limnochorda sp. L945t]